MSPHQSARPSSLPLLFSLLTAQAFALLFCVVARHQMPYALGSFLVVPLLIRLVIFLIGRLTHAARRQRPEEWQTIAAASVFVIFCIGALFFVFLAAIWGMNATVFWSMEGLFVLLLLSTIAAHQLVEDNLLGVIGNGWYLQVHLCGVLLGFVLAYLEYDTWYIRGMLLLSLALFLGTSLLIVWCVRRTQIQTNGAISRTAFTQAWRRLNRPIGVLVACIMAGIVLTTHTVVDWSILPASFPIDATAPYKTGPGNGNSSGATTAGSQGQHILAPRDLALLREVLIVVVLFMIVSFVLLVLLDVRRWMKTHHPHLALTIPHRSTPGVVAPPDEAISGMRAAYRTLLIAAARKDEQLQRQTDETSQEYARRLAITLATIDSAGGPPEWQQAIDTFTHLYQRARYRGDALNDADLAQAELLYQSLRKRLR